MTAEQQEIRERCRHPAGRFVPFTREATGQSVGARFEQQVGRHPDRLAVKTRGGQLTYAELNAAANRVARAVLDGGDRGEEPVSLLMETGLSMVVAMLGVLKAGKAFVPVDPTLPHVRLERMLQGTRARLRLTTPLGLMAGAALGYDRRTLLNVDGLLDGAPAPDPGLAVAPESLAYVLYTSGSTGQPKGVMQTHRNQLHHVMAHTNGCHFEADDRVGVQQPLTFTAGIWNMFCALLNGGAAILFDFRQEGLDRLGEWLRGERITFTDFTATVFRRFLGGPDRQAPFPDLRVVRLGSETVRAADVELYRRFLSDRCILYNGYGATESNHIRWYFLDKASRVADEIVPLGYSFEDKEVILLDDDLTEVAAGETGQIAVRSRYLSPGYWGASELTAQRFLPDPDGGDRRIYLTGDMGVLGPDGCLLHRGRTDGQVKVRGYRIETIEVEQALAALPGVKEAAVIAQDDGSGGRRLIGYVVPATDATVGVAALREGLAARVPDYMIPAAFVLLSGLPLTSRGKLDRAALPEPTRDRLALASPFAPPRTAVEEALAAIWAEVLGRDGIGVHDGFMELGGDSLQAGQVVGRVLQKFAVWVPANVLMESPTVADMAGLIAERLAAGRA